LALDRRRNGTPRQLEDYRHDCFDIGSPRAALPSPKFVPLETTVFWTRRAREAFGSAAASGIADPGRRAWRAWPAVLASDRKQQEHAEHATPKTGLANTRFVLQHPLSASPTSASYNSSVTRRELHELKCNELVPLKARTPKAQHPTTSTVFISQSALSDCWPRGRTIPRYTLAIATGLTSPRPGSATCEAVAGEVDADGNTADSKGMGVDGLFTDNCKTAVPARDAWLAQQ